MTTIRKGLALLALGVVLYVVGALISIPGDSTLLRENIAGVVALVAIASAVVGLVVTVWGLIRRPAPVD